MAVGTPVYPGGGPNTFVKSHRATGNLIVAFSRNPTDFPLARYVQYRDVDKDAGYYLRINTEQAGRIVGGKLSEYVWPDGADRPRRNAGTEKFKFIDYRTERYDYDFTLGYKAMNQADWNIRETEAAFHAQQAMTGRTVQVHDVLKTAGNWDANHKSDVSAILTNAGSWELSTTQRQDIKRSLNHGWDTIRKDTLGVVKKRDLQLVINPVTAQRIGESQEIVDYIKHSAEAWQQVKGDRPGKYRDYGLPDTLYGYPIVIEDTVMVTSRRGAATVVRQDVMGDGIAYLLARPGGLVSKAGSGPSFSTIMLFTLEELTVETKDDEDNRRTEGHVVDDVAPALTAPVSGFYFTGVTE